MIPIHRFRQSGSFIIEALVSMMIFMVGIVALVGLVAQSLNQVGQSKARNDASYLAGELISDMWVNASVDITAWQNRVLSQIPTATATVYFSTCDASISTSCLIANKVTGVQAIPKQQDVTVVISWTDRKSVSDPHFYQTSTMISRNK